MKAQGEVLRGAYPEITGSRRQAADPSDTRDAQVSCTRSPPEKHEVSTIIYDYISVSELLYLGLSYGKQVPGKSQKGSGLHGA